MSKTDWRPDLDGESGSVAGAASETDEKAISADQSYTPPPAHSWGSGLREPDPFLRENPAHDEPPVRDDTTEREAAELDRRKKRNEDAETEVLEEAEPTSAPQINIPPMPSAPPTAGKPKSKKSERKSALKTFKKKKDSAAKCRGEANEEAVKKREAALEEISNRKKEAEAAAGQAEWVLKNLRSQEDSEENQEAIKEAISSRREAKKELRSLIRAERGAVKEALEVERSEIQQAKQDEREAIKKAWTEAREETVKKGAPVRKGAKEAASTVSGAMSGEWSLLWSLGAAWVVPVTFPVALLDRLVMIFGSPRPLSGTERMDWDFFNGPGMWFGEHLDACASDGSLGRIALLAAVGIVPVAFAQFGELILNPLARKIAGWIAYGFPIFFVCMPSYSQVMGFHTVEDLYVTALAASAWWGFLFSRTLETGFAQFLLRIPLAAVIFGIGHTAPGAAF